jgi:hypothetical protein
MQITPGTVAAERDRLRRRADVVVPLINETRAALGDLFGVTVDPVGVDAYRREVDAVFADGAVAVNVAGYAGLLRRLDVADDHPGFVVDETLGRELAATIAGGQPLALLAQATFHFADVHTHGVAATDRPDGGGDGSGTETGTGTGTETGTETETGTGDTGEDEDEGEGEDGDGARPGDAAATARRGGGPAGADDLDAALAAGFPTRLPGWGWRERPSPFAVEPGPGSGADPESGSGRGSGSGSE